MNEYENEKTKVLDKYPEIKEKTRIELEEDFLKKFEILDKLGSGGFGTVYKAKDINLNQIVAIKVIPKRGISPELTERIKKEVKIARELSGKYVLRYWSLEEFKNSFAIVMEYLDYPTVQHVIELKEGFSEEEVKELLPSMLEGLEFLHNNRIIHRDIKPSNLFLITEKDEEGNEHKYVKFGDFGVVKDTSNDNQNLTRTNEAIGTLSYMSPEQLKGDTELTKSSDYYSLGVTIYQMLTGDVPFSGTFYEIYRAHSKNLEPKNINKIKDKRLKKLVLNLLERNPKKRWGEEEINRYLEGRKLPLSNKNKKFLQNLALILILFIIFIFSFFKIKINSEPSVSINENVISYYKKNKLLWERVIKKNFRSYFLFDVDNCGKKELLLETFEVLPAKENYTFYPTIYNEKGDILNLIKLVRPLEFLEFGKIYHFGFNSEKLFEDKKDYLIITLINYPWYPRFYNIWDPEKKEIIFKFSYSGAIDEFLGFGKSIVFYGLNNPLFHLQTIGMTEEISKLISKDANISDEGHHLLHLKSYQILENPAYSKIIKKGKDEIFVYLSSGGEKKLLPDGRLEGQPEGASQKTIELFNNYFQVLKFFYSNNLEKAKDLIMDSLMESKKYNLTGYEVIFNFLFSEFMARKNNFSGAINKCYEIKKLYPTYSNETNLMTGMYYFLNKEYKKAREEWSSSNSVQLAAGKSKEVILYNIYAVLMDYKNRDEAEKELGLAEGNLDGIWLRILEDLKCWLFFLEGELKEANEGFKESILNAGQEIGALGYFLTSFILNKFDEKEFENYIQNLGAHSSFLRWIGAVGNGKKSEAKAFFKTFENKRYRMFDYAFSYSLVQKVIEKYPEKFKEYI